VRLPRPAGTAARRALALLALLALSARVALAAPPAAEELARICAGAEDSAHCARLVEDVQLPRLPNLAAREGAALRVSLYPSGTITFADTEALHGGRSYSLWDFISELNTVVLYTTDGDDVTFTLLQRATGTRTELPAEPRVSPDRARLVTADFCDRRCVNELAVWRVTRDGIRKEASWKPRDAWTDAVATWKDSETLVVEYAIAGAQAHARLERRLADPGWIRSAAP
jgi:hypothetical protein